MVPKNAMCISSPNKLSRRLFASLAIGSLSSLGFAACGGIVERPCCEAARYGDGSAYGSVVVGGCL